MKACLAVAMLAMLSAGAPRVPAANDAPTLKVVLSRAGSYVNRFEHDLATLAAEEHYIQEVVGAGSVERRELRSDLLFVGRLGPQRFVEFRDVFEVDGRPVRERNQRLERLAVDASDESMRQIVTESARYNIGDIERTINVPLMPLMFLVPENQWRFKFAAQKGSQPPITSNDLPASPRFRATTEVWAVEYREVERPTFIRFLGGRKSIPAHGRFWIEPASGRVLMTELITEDRVHAAVDVSYESDPVLDLLLPIEMREIYWRPRQPVSVRGVATYGSFRRIGRVEKQ
jgi:hypothetical protein